MYSVHLLLHFHYQLLQIYQFQYFCFCCLDIFCLSYLRSSHYIEISMFCSLNLFLVYKHLDVGAFIEESPKEYSFSSMVSVEAIHMDLLMLFIFYMAWNFIFSWVVKNLLSFSFWTRMNIGFECDFFSLMLIPVSSIRSRLSLCFIMVHIPLYYCIFLMS